MYTQCPQCETYFRVSDGDLAAAEGQVRCSRCQEIFDARARLLTPAQERALPAGEQGAAGDPAIGDLFGAEGPDAEPSFGDAALEPGALDGTRADPSFDQPPTGAPFGFELPTPLADAGRPRARRAPLLATCLALTLTLTAQLVHANRDPLARDPRIGPALVGAYQRLHLPLQPPSDLARLAVQRADVTSHPVYRDVLYITATITNEADFTQPLPLLRVRLDDRWGEPVGVRIFRPDEYLRHAEPGTGAEPGRAYGIALEVVDPGNEAVGYALTPCLPQGDTLVCLGEG